MTPFELGNTILKLSPQWGGYFRVAEWSSQSTIVFLYVGDAGDQHDATKTIELSIGDKCTLSALQDSVDINDTASCRMMHFAANILDNAETGYSISNLSRLKCLLYDFKHGIDANKSFTYCELNGIEYGK